jgi:hypothetical protein
MKYNWKYLRRGKNIIFGLCIGDRLVREVMSDASAKMFETLHPDDEFENSIDDFWAKAKRIFEAKRDGKYVEDVLAEEGYIKFINRQKKLYHYGEAEQKQF